MRKYRLQNVEISIDRYQQIFSELSLKMMRIGREFHGRGWLLGTSGNMSTMVSYNPFIIAITASGLDKGNLTEEGILVMDGSGKVLSGKGKPSSESALHLAAVRGVGAGSVIHTHSVWGTILSRLYEREGGFSLQGYEMLKGLENVTSHTHSEWIPVIPNSQDMLNLSAKVETMLRDRRDLHCFLLAGHGLYVWGKNLNDAKRHAEAIEFLLEVHGRSVLSGVHY